MKITEIVSDKDLSESLTGEIGKFLFRKGAKRAATKAEPEGVVDKLYRSAQQGQRAKDLKALQAQKLAYASKFYSEEAMNVIKTFALVETVIEYNWKKYQLDQKYKGDENNPEYQKELITLRGQMITQWIAPKVAGMLVNKAATLTTLKHTHKLITVLGMKNLGTVLRDWTKPAIQATLVGFFMSPAGGKWLTDSLGALILGVGSIPTLASNLYDYVMGNEIELPPALGGKPRDPDAGPSGDADAADDVDATSGTGQSGNKVNKQPSKGYNFSLSDLSGR